jgi:uncharacterized protein YndB with AHSA1/START domain
MPDARSEAIPSPIADRAITITRIVNAPSALAWKACTESDHIDKWWGPNGFTNKTLSMDVRVGGTWKYTMTGPDGKVWPNLITYRDVRPNELLAYDHGDWENPKHFEASLTFTEVAEGTLITLRCIFPTKEERDLVVKEHGAIEGGEQTLAHLDEYLSQKLDGREISRPDNPAKP